MLAWTVPEQKLLGEVVDVVEDSPLPVIFLCCLYSDGFCNRRHHVLESGFTAKTLWKIICSDHALLLCPAQRPEGSYSIKPTHAVKYTPRRHCTLRTSSAQDNVRCKNNVHCNVRDEHALLQSEEELTESTVTNVFT